MTVDIGVHGFKFMTLVSCSGEGIQDKQELFCLQGCLPPKNINNVLFIFFAA
jgi:hypothetical protein